MLPKRRILSIDVSRGTFSEFEHAILSYASRKQSSYVCVANVHMAVEAYNSEAFQGVVNGADIVTPDGMPLAKCFYTFYREKQDRVDGMTLLPRLLRQSAKRGMSVFFYGGTEVMLSCTRTYLEKYVPGLNIVGMYSPPYRPLTEIEKDDVAAMVTESGANIVFVVLGCPKQEQWMAEMKGRIPSVMVGIGGALPVMVGLQKRAPKWMQDNSLEWVYRLIQEPRRLFNRYFTTNTIFLYLLFKEKIRGVYAS